MQPVTHAKRLACVLLAIISAAAGLPVQADNPELDLDEAVSVALRESPMLAAMEARTQALGTMPAQAGALPDPMLSVNAMNLPVDTLDRDQEPMTQLQLAVSQSLPFPGKRGLKQEIAELTVEAQQQQVSEARNQLVSQVRSAWWQLLAAEKGLAIIDSNRSLLSDVVEIARTKYSVGEGLQQEVLLAEVELNRLLERKFSLRGMRDSAAARLAGLLNLPPGTSVRTAYPAAPPVLPELPPAGTLAGLAAQERDLLEVHRKRIDAARRQVDLAEKEKFPDFRVGFGYGIRDGSDAAGRSRPDFVSVMFSMNLPVYAAQKQNRQIAQRVAEHDEQQLLFDDTVRNIAAEIESLQADYSASRQQAMLLRDSIIPQAKQTVTSMVAGYQVSKVDFLNVVNGQTMLYSAEISYWKLVARAKGNLARLAAVVGQESIYE